MRKIKQLIKNWRQLMIHHQQQGKFIVLEGLDRSGKSAMSHAIASKINQLQPKAQVFRTGFPNRTTAVGQMIDQFLKNKLQIGQQVIHLLFSANRWQCMPDINKKLTEGKHIVCDRYWYSGVAYSSAKGLDYEWCLNADKGLKQPDIVIYLRADADILGKRLGYGIERFEKIQFQKKVGIIFDKLLQSKAGQKVQIVEVGQKNQQEVKKEIENIIQKFFNP